jgi:hypothetical protein
MTSNLPIEKNKKKLPNALEMLEKTNKIHTTIIQPEINKMMEELFKDVEKDIESRSEKGYYNSDISFSYVFPLEKGWFFNFERHVESIKDEICAYSHDCKDEDGNSMNYGISNLKISFTQAENSKCKVYINFNIDWVTVA